MIRQFKTNLRCAGCVQSIAPIFNGAPGIDSWTADVSTPDKVITLKGTDVSRERVGGLLEKAGYKITGELPAAAHTAEANRDSEKTSFFPLALIVGFLLGVVLLVEVARGSFVWPLAMTNFMAGWFLVFSFFKLLDVKAFADSYQTYDLLAARSRLYALGYPFIELALGIAFLLRYELKVVNGVTLIVMLIGTVGVVRTLISRRKIRCACLGAVFNLPMSYVTLAEDVLMVAMAAVMLVM